MDFAAIGGPLISAGASLLGSKMSADATNKAARLNAIVQAQENAANRAWNEQMFDKQTALQREFAQSGIQWRADDARAAGLHPLAAMGAQTHSFSANVGQSNPSTSTPFAGASMGSGFAAAGADISRALQATRTEDQRVDAFNKTVQDLTIQKMGMENALLASQIAKVNQPGTPPAMPSQRRSAAVPGQGNAPKSTDRVEMKKMEVQHSAPGNAVTEPKPITEVGHTVTKNTPSGRYAPVMSDLAKDRLEEDMIGTLLWTWRNRIMPTFGANYNAPNIPLAKGKEWLYHPLTQEYMPVKRNPQPSGSRLFRRKGG
nr:MAG: DNA pilot protein [Microvirus sp.]